MQASVARMHLWLVTRRLWVWPRQVGNILLWRLIMKYFLWSFSPFRWFKPLCPSCSYICLLVRTFIWLRRCAGWSWSLLVAYYCIVGIAVPRITCFIVHCRYFLCDVGGVAHCITLCFRVWRRLCLLFITSTSWRSRDGETLMLIHDKDYFVLVLIYYTKLFIAGWHCCSGAGPWSPSHQK